MTDIQPCCDGSGCEKCFNDLLDNQQSEERMNDEGIKALIDKATDLEEIRQMIHELALRVADLEKPSAAKGDCPYPICPRCGQNDRTLYGGGCEEGKYNFACVRCGKEFWI